MYPCRNDALLRSISQTSSPRSSARIATLDAVDQYGMLSAQTVATISPFFSTITAACQQRTQVDSQSVDRSRIWALLVLGADDFQLAFVEFLVPRREKLGIWPQVSLAIALTICLHIMPDLQLQIRTIVATFCITSQLSLAVFTARCTKFKARYCYANGVCLSVCLSHWGRLPWSYIRYVWLFWKQLGLRG